VAGRSPHAIEVIDLAELAQVCGGIDKQTSATQLAIAQATSAMQDVAKSLAPKDTGTLDMLMQMVSMRRSGSGPSSAPALPPTSTLTR
jgi:hypothetical protein